MIDSIRKKLKKLLDSTDVDERISRGFNRTFQQPVQNYTRGVQQRFNTRNTISSNINQSPRPQFNIQRQVSQITPVVANTIKTITSPIPSAFQYSQQQPIKKFTFNNIINPIGQTISQNPQFSKTPVGRAFAGDYKNILPSVVPTLQRSAQAQKNTFAFDTKTKKLVNPRLASDISTQAVLNILGGPTGTIKSKINKNLEPAVNYLRGKLRKEDVYLIDEFVDAVASGRGNKNLGEVGSKVQSMLPLIFGNEAATWSNKKAASSLRYVLNRLSEGKNSVGIGLSVNDVSDNFAKKVKIKGRTQIQKDLSKAIEEGTTTPVNFGKLSLRKQREINALLAEAGSAPITNPSVRVYPNVIDKIRNTKISQKLTPENIADIAFSVIHGRSKAVRGRYPQTVKLVKQKANKGNINTGIVGEFDEMASLKSVYPDNPRKIPLGGGGSFPPSSLTSKNAPQTAKISAAQRNSIDNIISQRGNDPLEFEKFMKGQIPDTKTGQVYSATPKVKVRPQAEIQKEIKEFLDLKRQVDEDNLSTKLSNEQIKTYTPPGSFTNTRADQIANVAPTNTSRLKIQGQSQQGRPSLDPEDFRLQTVSEPSSQTTRLGQQQALMGQKISTGEYGQSPIRSSFDDIVRKSDINVKDKVNILDYFRTPDRVFQKVGLKKEVELLRRKEDDYLKELPIQIDKITEWSNRVSGDANQRIFKYLDGQTNSKTLNTNELKVANEIKKYFSEWADRLKLPKDKRITSYITHVFDKDFIQKEFDPEIAKLIRERVPGSVYDPFVEARLGKAGYIEDTWKALDAYVKRATRKVHMDEALEQIAKKADDLEESQFKYVKGRLDRINMRPTWIDNMIDNTIKSVVGYRFGQRPVASLSRSARQMVYRATLGLNPGTALKNLTQGANTYAKLGEKYTVIGYSKLLKSLATGSDELERVGVLKKDFIQDRTISATGKFWEKADKGLFFFFEGAEKINRGAAYYGAKAKALANGATEQEAIEAGKKIVRDTQFTFGAVDTPAVLSSDIGKTLGQFQSFTLKQGEFLGEMVKNKDIIGMIRWTGASLGMVYTLGELIGMEPADLIPSLRIGVPPTLQLPVEIGGALLNTPDKYGQERDLLDKVGDVGNAALLFAPGSTQFKKTFEGLRDVSRGYSTNDFGVKGIINTITGNEGKIRFPIEQNPINLIRGALFGTNNLPEAQEYYDNERTPLGENQTKIFKSLGEDGKAYYNDVIQKRELEEQVKNVSQIQFIPEEGNIDVDSSVSIQGLNSDQIKAKEEVAKAQVKLNGGVIWVGDKIIFNVDGESKSIDISPPTKGQGIGAFKNQDWNISKAREIWNNDGIPHEEKNKAFKKLGVKAEDVRYDALANYSVDIKTQYVISKSPDHDTLFDNLISGRMRSIGDNVFASDGVLDNLYDEGLITSEERKTLKALDYNKDGTLKKSGNKGKKLNVPELKSLNLPKVNYSQNQTKFSSPEFKTISIRSGKNTGKRIPIKKPNVDPRALIKLTA